MPKTVCTFTGLKKLYLRPDARTDNHPGEISRPIPPNAGYTTIIPTAGKNCHKDVEKDLLCKQETPPYQTKHRFFSIAPKDLSFYQMCYMSQGDFICIYQNNYNNYLKRATARKWWTKICYGSICLYGHCSIWPYQT